MDFQDMITTKGSRSRFWHISGDNCYHDNAYNFSGFQQKIFRFCSPGKGLQLNMFWKASDNNCCHGNVFNVD